MPKIFIWTQGYRPFILGGDVRASVGCQVEATGPFDLGKGYHGFLVVKPDGQTVVAESQTGALIGPTLEEVRADIKKANKSVMVKQMDWARAMAKQIHAVSHKDFWQMIERGFL